MYNSKLTIIQGDTLRRVIAIRLTGGDKLDNNIINKIYFTCNKLGITNKVIDPKKNKAGKDIEGLYILSFTSEETKLFPKCYTNYDITVELGNCSNPRIIKTIQYQYPLEVLEKNNFVEYES